MTRESETASETKHFSKGRLSRRFLNLRFLGMISAAPSDSPASLSKDKGEKEVRDEDSMVGKLVSLAKVKKIGPS